MHKNHLLTVAAGALLAFATAPAMAGTITVESSRWTATGDTTLIDFATESDGDLIGSIGDVSFENAYGDSDLSAIGFFGGTGGVVAVNTPDVADIGSELNPIELTFANDISRIGWDGATNPGTTVLVELLANGGTTSVGTHEFGAIGGFERFFGLSSDMAFDTVKITTNQLQTSSALHAMNDLQFDVAVVPLPPAAYMGLGLLAGLAIFRRRRRSASI